MHCVHGSCRRWNLAFGKLCAVWNACFLALVYGQASQVKSPWSCVSAPSKAADSKLPNYVPPTRVLEKHVLSSCKVNSYGRVQQTFVAWSTGTTGTGVLRLALCNSFVAFTLCNKQLLVEAPLVLTHLSCSCEAKEDAVSEAARLLTNMLAVKDSSCIESNPLLKRKFQSPSSCR